MLTKTVIVRQFLPFFIHIGTAGFRRWAVRWLPIDSVQKLRQIVNVMERIARLVLTERLGHPQDEALEGKESLKKDEGRDLMSILCTCEFIITDSTLTVLTNVVAENARSSSEDRLSQEELEGLIS